jgi:hypothetical protein
MEYHVTILNADPLTAFPEYQWRCTSKKRILEEHKKYLREAFDKESVLLYRINENYTDVVPPIEVRKKTDWRLGTDEQGLDTDEPNRKKYLKYKYLGKAVESKIKFM